MIRAILVDDEELALHKLANLLTESGAVDAAGAYEDPTDALEAITSGAAGVVDVVFLDIDMPGISGLALADKMLQVNSGISVVFVTAHNEYAIEAFELNAIDYLLKPVRRDRLQKTLHRIMGQPRVPVKQEILDVACFGGFRVSTKPDDKSQIKWRTSKAEELFAFLVHHQGEPVSRGEIIDSLWPDLFPDKAVTHFHTTLYYIRKTLSNAGVKDCIIHDKGFYKVDIHQIHCDYYGFEQLAKITLAKVAEQAVPPLQDVVSQYQGEYLHDRGYPWAEEPRAALEQRYVALLLQLHACYVELGRFPLAAQVLQRAYKCDPLNERIHEKLIRVYLLMNDRMAAMKQYDALRRKLKAEYGVEPADSVKRLLGIK